LLIGVIITVVVVIIIVVVVIIIVVVVIIIVVVVVEKGKAIKEIKIVSNSSVRKAPKSIRALSKVINWLVLDAVKPTISQAKW
jgi:flagellar basal body-associated protein FliL